MVRLQRLFVALAMVGTFLISPSCGLWDGADKERAHAWVNDELAGVWTVEDPPATLTVRTSTSASEVEINRCASNGWVGAAWACEPMDKVPVAIDLAWKDGATSRLTGNVLVAPDPRPGGFCHLHAWSADSSLSAELRDGVLIGYLPGQRSFSAKRASR